jgi:hypothetical protein
MHLKKNSTWVWWPASLLSEMGSVKCKAVQMNRNELTKVSLWCSKYIEEEVECSEGTGHFGPEHLDAAPFHS